METGGDRSSATVGTGFATNTGEDALHQPSPSTEQVHGSTDNNHLDAHPSTLSNNSTSSSQNPFLEINDATNNKGNPFHEPTNTNGALESRQNQPSANETVPINVESHDPFQGMVNSNMGTPISPSSESSRQGQIHDVIATPGSDSETGRNQGSEIQNPPVQVMERSSESDASSQYIFPSHVFSRNNTNTPVEWSTASNESLFSIYMGNMSFSHELVCFKSCELDKPGDVYIHDPPNASPSNQPPTPVNKFNDISQRTAELHEESSKVTEAKAAETMREVIMESSLTTESAGNGNDKGPNSHCQSEGSSNSYAFQSSKGRDKNLSSKSVREKQDQAKETETAKADDETPESTTNAPPNKRLGCFACCPFCN